MPVCFHKDGGKKPKSSLFPSPFLKSRFYLSICSSVSLLPAEDRAGKACPPLPALLKGSSQGVHSRFSNAVTAEAGDVYAKHFTSICL